ncbi:hypothetical protein [Bacillus cereus]|uniref:Uncharacterized protein n=1 Tax=Bacillus cereus TaxID=1396 RepID=A0A0G8EFE3_BACCE|nr:hypothetical protein [Bacillus cereus]KLA22192.1 hypothetical protein B4077_3138 [Bacillus cereus]
MSNQHEDILKALVKKEVLNLDQEKLANFSKELSEMGLSAKSGFVACNGNYCIVVKE